MKSIYLFSEGKKEMKDLLGGKGANLAEMTNLGVPVPFGFTITTEVCDYYTKNNTYPDEMEKELDSAIAKVEEKMGMKFNDTENPLLFSIRSGAAVSMPGMMDTILNLGLNDQTVEALIKKTNNPRFVWDSYRRFIQMFGDVSMNVEHHKFEEILHTAKETKGVSYDIELDADDLKSLVNKYKALVKKEAGRDFPQDPREQLKMSINAVFGSWNNDRAVLYRKLNNITGLKGTAVNVQAMVFGNMGENSGTGVCFSRNPSTGENVFYGEYLMNAQGEDVVAGIRTPHPLADLEKELPGVYKELVDYKDKLEQHYKDMQDMEFTIQEGKLYMLQTRIGKRTAAAAVKIAVDMIEEGLITEKEAVLRIDANQLDQLLHPQLNPIAKQKSEVAATGLPASPGAAVGEVVFDAVKAAEIFEKDKTKVVLVRNETSPEDLIGMNAAQGILTARGGMTCIAGDTKLLTTEGFTTAEALFEEIGSRGKQKKILSFDSRTMGTVWKNVIAAGRRTAKTSRIELSQTGRSKNNTIRITPDHKFLTFKNRAFVKKPLNDLLVDREFACVIDRIPSTGSVKEPEKAYVVGAILTDGYISVKPTKGSVTFIQKQTKEKQAFIDAVKDRFKKTFGEELSYTRKRHTNSELGGRTISGSANDFICFKRAPAQQLMQIQQSLVDWALGLDEESSFNFLAGVIDGDGTFHNNRINIYIAKENFLQAVVLTCLKLGILPQVTTNRGIYNVQVRQGAEELLQYTKRVKGTTRPAFYGSKLFSARQLFSDLNISYEGKMNQMLKRNLLFDAEKIKRSVIPLCSEEVKPQLRNVIDSDLRMMRVKETGEVSEEFVYNFEVDAVDDLNKNFVVFTTKYVPLLVSNSHAAVVARGMGKCCVAGCQDVTIKEDEGHMIIAGQKIVEGDTISLDGTEGKIYIGAIPTVDPDLSGNFGKIMELADKYRLLRVRTNADTPRDARVARKFGAEGIGLCRTEHMFFEGDRINIMREMILASDRVARKRALDKLLPMQQEDFKGLFDAMEGLPVTIRLLDPPLHEFLPRDEADMKEVAGQLGVTLEQLKEKMDSLHESNPMLGHRGVRLAITYPEIAEMQATAIIQAALEVRKEGKEIIPEIMIPLVGNVTELAETRKLVVKVADRLIKESGLEMKYLVGTMIEIPRAALTADEVAKEAEFFSFGTNDLTQMTLGFSRDDVGSFVPEYLSKNLLEADPFQKLDQTGVGQLVKMAVEKGKQTRPDIKLGICGEHGGEPSSIGFCHDVGLAYVSCSPYRVPIARLAAAQAAIRANQ